MTTTYLREYKYWYCYIIVYSTKYWYGTVRYHYETRQDQRWKINVVHCTTVVLKNSFERSYLQLPIYHGMYLHRYVLIMISMNVRDSFRAENIFFCYYGNTVFVLVCVCEVKYRNQIKSEWCKGEFFDLFYEYNIIMITIYYWYNIVHQLT